jgi:single-stranded DNA-binding protein
MSAHVLVSGAIFRQPEQRTSRAGKPFVTATIKAKDGAAAQFWRVTAFSESAQEEMLRLSDGDAVSAQGSMKAELYRPDGGEPRLSLSMVADQVLALRLPQHKRERKAPDESNEARSYSASETTEKRASDGGDEFGDDIPF